MTKQFLLLSLAASLVCPALSLAQTEATGIVFVDENENQIFDEGERPLEGIRISNGLEIVKTDVDGRYTLPIDDDTQIFVIKPRNYRTLLSDDMLPRFYYTHKPNGSPDSRFAGVEPTGPLPESVDFPLYPQSEPDQFRAVLWADPQPRNMREIEYITHDVIEELIGVDAAFGVTLGDIMFDDIGLFEEQNSRVALIGIPWYNVIGNHDLNMDAKVDELSDETYERVFGPNYYSFDYGPTHFIVLDTVHWYWNDDEDKGTYRGGIDDAQLEFVKNDLEFVPEDQLIVLLMHIPLTVGQMDDGERAKLFELMDDREFTLSISGHTHYQEHVFVGSDMGWNGPEKHHHVINVTVSGSWWSGAPDEYGIPHTMMRDGAPNGYSFITFDGNEYSIEFKAARRPASHQISIYTPEKVSEDKADDLEVIVNVFAGSEKSTVEMQVGSSGWTEMTRFDGEDPYFADLKRAEESENPPNGRKLPGIRKETPHLWKAALPSGLQPGAHLISVRTTDMWGQKYEAERVLIIREAN